MPQPRIPNFAGGCTANLIPSLLGPTGTATVPEWMPREVEGARQVVLMVVDGLGWHQLAERRHLVPTLSAGAGGAITTVAPSTTVTALTSISTGLAPGEHGMMGYRMDLGKRPVQMLRWADDRGDVRALFPPLTVQPTPPFLGASVPILSKAELEGTAFTEAHLRGGKPQGWRVASSIPVRIGQLLEEGTPFIYAYYDGVDKVAHERGFGPYYDAELTFVDSLIGQIVERLTPESVLLVTADHGQVHVGDNTINLDSRLIRHVQYQSGEGRFRWLHARSGAVDELLTIASDLYADRAWVVSREQAVDGQWFGPRVTDVARKRLGDVALVAHADVSFDDPGDQGAFELVCRHGSLTAAEMDVPLLAWRKK